MRAQPVGDVQVILSGTEARDLYAELYRISVDILGNSYQGANYPTISTFLGLLDHMGYDT